jgi:hypothetical protein
VFLSLRQRVWREVDAYLRAPRANERIRLIDPLPQHPKGAKEKGNDGLHPLRPRRTAQPRYIQRTAAILNGLGRDHPRPGNTQHSHF